VVGAMWCFWVFNRIALVSLPDAIRTGQPTIIINWVSSNWIQLILLPALMVGQNLRNVAADARASKTFTDVETILAHLDTADRRWAEGRPRRDRGSGRLADVSNDGAVTQVIKYLIIPGPSAPLRTISGK
jgi:hypothetical protein